MGFFLRPRCEGTPGDHSRYGAPRPGPVVVPPVDGTSSRHANRPVGREELGASPGAQRQGDRFFETSAFALRRVKPRAIPAVGVVEGGRLCPADRRLTTAPSTGARAPRAPLRPHQRRNVPASCPSEDADRAFAKASRETCFRNVEHLGALIIARPATARGMDIDVWGGSSRAANQPLGFSAVHAGPRSRAATCNPGGFGTYLASGSSSFVCEQERFGLRRWFRG